MMYHALINNNHVLDDLKGKKAIFKKVKLGNCYKYDGAIAQPFYISFDERTLNYHIVPEIRKIEEYMKNIRENLNKKDTFNKLGYKAKINTHTTSCINLFLDIYLYSEYRLIYC